MIRALIARLRRPTVAERLDRVAPECRVCEIARQGGSEYLFAHELMAHRFRGRLAL